MNDTGITHKPVEGTIPIHGFGGNSISHEYLKVGIAVDGPPTADGGPGTSNLNSLFNGGDQRGGHRFNAGHRLIGSKARRIQFQLRKTGNPPGEVRFGIGNTADAGVNIEVGRLPTSEVVPVSIEETRTMVEFPCDRVILANDVFYVEYTDAGSNASNVIHPLRSTIDALPNSPHATIRFTASGTWDSLSTTRHLRCYVYVA